MIRDVNFSQVYVLTNGDCIYQGATNKLVPYLENMKLPCPMYHNPADYSMYNNSSFSKLFRNFIYQLILLYGNIAVIELACGEYGNDKIDTLIMGSQNGRNLQWFDNPEALKDAKSLRGTVKIESHKNDHIIIKLYNSIRYFKIL